MTIVFSKISQHALKAHSFFIEYSLALAALFRFSLYVQVNFAFGNPVLCFFVLYTKMIKQIKTQMNTSLLQVKTRRPVCVIGLK